MRHGTGHAQPNYLHRDGGSAFSQHSRHEDDYAHDVPHLSHTGGSAYRSVPNADHDKHGHGGHQQNSHHRHGETIKEHMQKRKLTDVHCCCCFIIFTLVFMSITQYAWTKGNPQRLYHGFDYQGRLCGVDENVQQKPLLYWPDPDHLEVPVCVGECPADVLQKVSYPDEEVLKTHDNNVDRTDIVRTMENLPTYPSKEMAGRFCLPTQGQSKLASLTRKIIGEEEGEASFTAMVANTFKDLTNAWSVLLLVLPAACIVCYAYIFMLRSCAKILLVNFFFILIATCIGIAFYCLIYVGWNLKRSEEVAGKYSDHPRWITGGLGWFCVLVAVGSWAAILVVWPVMDKSSNSIQAACKTMCEVNMMLTMPMLEIFAKVLFFGLWCYNFSFVLTNGEIASAEITVEGKPVHGLVTRFHYTTLQISHIFFYVIGFIWTAEVITMIFKFVITYVMAHWYFEPCREDLSKKEVTMAMWKEGFKQAFISHFGSLVLSAALMSIFCIYRPIESLLEFLIKQSKEIDNPLTKAVEYSCSCCTKCVKEVVMCVNKTAMIEMVLLADQDFFVCAKSSYKVMLNADKDISTLQGLTTVYHMMGVLFTASVGACITFFVTGNIGIFTSRSSQYYLESRIGICVAAFIMSFTVAMVFMYTLEMVSDSLLFCWVIEGYDDKARVVYAPKELRNLVFEDVQPKNKRQGHTSLWEKDQHHDKGHTGTGHQPLRHHDDLDMRSDGGWSSSSHLTKGGLRQDSHHHERPFDRGDRDRDRDHGRGWIREH
mmetsp:Transcript_148076/g.258313  ORF Transcript_148076/g.258313 Transcript_148076/m.258313 type:complete len:769 (+) Transcript_148076:91-2397(+)